MFGFYEEPGASPRWSVQRRNCGDGAGWPLIPQPKVQRGCTIRPDSACKQGSAPSFPSPPRAGARLLGGALALPLSYFPFPGPSVLFGFALPRFVLARGSEDRGAQKPSKVILYVNEC